MTARGARRGEKGAALLVVLMLVATLSFIVLSISERMIFASSRALNARARAELHWRIVGAESLARASLSAASSDEKFRFAMDNPFFASPHEIPMEGGAAIIAFRDASRCFNMNSLAEKTGGEAGGGKDLDNGAADELGRILRAAGVANADTDAVAAVAADWIDEDSFQRPRGAEDGHYAGLPTPYRTGSALLSDQSELRAMSAIDQDAYEAMCPFLCALPVAVPSQININMLTEADGALVVGLVGEEVSLAQAQAVIGERPQGGYLTVEQFWANDVFAGKAIPETVKSRVTLESKFVEADVDIRLYDQHAQVSMLFELDGKGEVRLVSRRIGAAPE